MLHIFDKNAYTQHIQENDTYGSIIQLLNDGKHPQIKG